jgi:DNA-binding NarL/FixJ family response regulator
VFRLIARGLSNGEIGRELYISDTTVKTHITHILQRLDLRDRVQAVEAGRGDLVRHWTPVYVRRLGGGWPRILG